jgi:metal-dependent amidase/aminoacylase/carboxypeptidase family protein
MPILNRIAEFHADMTAWRHDIHTHPEMAFKEYRTSELRRREAHGVRHSNRPWSRRNWPGRNVALWRR